MNKRKIAIVNSIFPYGSTGRICFDMSNYFLNAGFNVNCFYGEGHKNKNHSFLNKFSKIWNVFLTRIDDRAGLHASKATRKMILQIRRFSPDIVIVHNLHAYYLNIKIFLEYLSSSKTPAIFVFHDCWNFTGHCAYFSYANCNKWKDNCNRCPNLKDYPASLFKDNSFCNFKLKKELFGRIQNKVIVTSPSARYLLQYSLQDQANNR